MSCRAGVRTISVICVAVVLHGCASTGGVSGKQVLGAAVGGVVGAGICLAVTRNPVACALAGVGGAIAGWGVGTVVENYARQQRSFEAERAEFGYQPAQGTRIEMRKSQTSPETVAPGQSLEVITQYALLGPDAEKPIAITETLSVWRDGNEIVKGTAKVVERLPGGWEVSDRLKVPEKAPPGRYQVKQELSAGNAKSASLTPFVVAAN